MTHRPGTAGNCGGYPLAADPGVSSPGQAQAAMDMPSQDLGKPFRGPAAPKCPDLHATRIATFATRTLTVVLPAVLLTATPTVLAARLGTPLGVVEWVFVIIAALLLAGLSIPVGIALIGALWAPSWNTRHGQEGRGLDIAVLLPMFDEPADETIGNGMRLVDALRRVGRGHHRFSLHVLSDSRTPEARAEERSAFGRWRAHFPEVECTYRLRPVNTDYKSGNVRAWIGHQGGAHDAMLILDADSAMGSRSVLQMADAMASDPSLGLIQTVLRVRPGPTPWQRIESFRSEVYGRTHGRGMALLSGREATFLGHNALVRIRAFAASAGLPHLSGSPPFGGVILSHDLVEAALLRRAGWGVRLMPQAGESFEGAPENLVAHLLRDRRWCQGNLQHLRLLATPGIGNMSRFHFLRGALSYAGSLGWFGLTVIGMLLAPTGAATGLSPQAYWLIVTSVGLAALAPRLVAATDYAMRRGVHPVNVPGFAALVLLETGFSALLAPTIIIHHLAAVLCTLAGRDGGWAPHIRGQPTLRFLARFHRVELLCGGMLALAVTAGWLPGMLWALPLALLSSLPLSFVLSRVDANAPERSASDDGGGPV